MMEEMAEKSAEDQTPKRMWGTSGELRPERLDLK